MNLKIFVRTKHFWTKQFLDQNFFQTKNIFGKKILYQNFFGPTIFLTKISFGPKNFLDQKFFRATILFSLKFFRTKFFFQTKSFFYKQNPKKNCGWWCWLKMILVLSLGLGQVEQQLSPDLSFVIQNYGPNFSPAVNILLVYFGGGCCSCSCS